MHGYKKPKNEWARKKIKNNKFNEQFGYEDTKDRKKNKRSYRIQNNFLNENDYK